MWLAGDERPSSLSSVTPKGCRIKLNFHQNYCTRNVQMEKVNFIYNNNKDVQVPIGTMGAPPFVPRFVFVRFPSNEFALFGQVKSNVILIVCWVPQWDYHHHYTASNLTSWRWRLKFVLHQLSRVSSIFLFDGNRLIRYTVQVSWEIVSHLQSYQPDPIRNRTYV